MIGNRLTVVLLVIVALLGALAGWLTLLASQDDAPLAVSPTPVPAVLVTESSSSVPIPPLDELSETLERPLFIRGRRPPAMDSVVEDAPMEAPTEQASTVMTVELSAVVLETGRQYALFRQSGQDSLVRVELGEKVEGWVVREIRTDGVRLERGTQTQDLPLRTFKPPAQAATPVRGKAARRAKAPAPATSRATTTRRPRRAVRGPRQRQIVRQ